VQARSGAAEVVFFRHGDEITQLPEFDTHSVTRWRYLYAFHINH
jgi:hypothetical protein